MRTFKTPLDYNFNRLGAHVGASALDSTVSQ